MNELTPPAPESNSRDYLEDHTISIGDIMLGLARQIRIILIIPTILCTLAIVYVFFFAKPLYISESKIVSSNRNVGGMSQAVGLAAQFGINIPTAQAEQKWVYPEIIQSRLLSRAVLKQKFDTDEFGPQKSLIQILTYGNNKLSNNRNEIESIAIERLLKMISISEDKLTGIITLSIGAKEPNLAANLNKAFIEQLDTHQRNYNKAKTSETRQFIEDRIKDTEMELQDAEDALKIFMDRNRRIDNSPALRLEQQRYEREVTVLTGVFTTLKQQLETTKIEEVKESDYVVVLDPPNAPIKPSKPRKKLLVVLMGILGICIGIMTAFVREIASNANKKEQNKIEEAKSLLFKNIYNLISRKSN